VAASSADAGAAAAGVPAAGVPAARVREVELRLDAPLGRPVELRPLVAVVPGVRLTEQAVRRTLSNFYATGLVSEAELSTRQAAPPVGETGRWVTVVVSVYGRSWVESVEIAGEPGLPTARVRRAIRQQPGTPLREEELLAGHYALQELYAERGYRQARVWLEVAVEPGSKRARVVYHLDAGPRSTIGDVDFEGDLGGHTGDELRAALRLEPGDPYDGERVANQAERLRGWLARHHHLAATVGAPREAHDPESHRIRLTFPVDAGPAVEVVVEGFPLRRLEDRGVLLFLRDRNLDPEVIERSCEEVEGFLQEKGHYRARCRHRLEEAGEGHRLVLEVEPGPEYRVEEIRFTGNRVISSDELRRLLDTSVHRTIDPGSGHLVSTVLEEDLANLRSYYLLQGFDRVEVGPAAVYEDGEELSMTIPIREGRRRRVVDLTFAGNRHFDGEKLRADLPLESGGPFHPVLLDDAVNVVRALYEERGYLDAGVTPSLDWNDEGTLVDVHFEIYEGPRALVDRILLRGQRHSRPEAIRRFIDLESGDPVSRRRLLEVERELYRLGIFSRVDVELRPATGDPGRRDVVVHLEEGRRWRLAYGVSYHSEDGVGGLLSLTRNNVGGRGDRLQLDLRANTVDRRFRVIYDQPTFLRRNLPITYTIFQQEEERESFTVENLGGQMALTKDFPSLRLGLIYDYRLVDLSAETIDPGEVERELRELEISSLTPNLFLDRRDDPLEPTRGWTTALQLEYAFPFLSADADFLKLFWQQTHYLPLGRGGVIAGSFRVGAIEPLSPQTEPDPLVPPELASAAVPVSERFFAGGRTTHRAFERDQLGILGETLLERPGGDLLELGGNGLLLLNLDYRFPISGPVGGTVFFDLGNVWADWRDVDAQQLELGAGIGVRYRSPIGPLRLEVGWPIDTDLPDDGPVFLLSFGNPF